jgi:hypothetical protein
MNHTETHYKLAQKCAERFAQDPRVVAFLLTGSTVMIGCDEVSDIDCTVYYSDMPSETEADAMCQQAIDTGGGVYGRDGSEFAVYEFIDGIKSDFGHTRWSEMETFISGFLTDPDLSNNDFLIMSSGFYYGKSLYGNGLIEGLQAKMADYPTIYQQRLATKHLRFPPTTVLTEMGLARNDILLVQEELFHAVENMFGLLCAVNQIYHPGKTKSMAFSVGKMAHKPPDFMARINELFMGSPADGVRKVPALIQETLTLVETHLPEIDTSRTRKIIDFQLRR